MQVLTEQTANSSRECYLKIGKVAIVGNQLHISYNFTETLIFVLILYMSMEIPPHNLEKTTVSYHLPIHK